MTITWTISQLDRTLSDGYVHTAHWRVVATEDTYTATAYSTCQFDGTLTTPYEDLTEADVLSWVWATIDKDATEASLAAQITAQQFPTTGSGVPWVTTGSGVPWA